MTTYPTSSETETAQPSVKAVVLDEIGKKYSSTKKAGGSSGGFNDFWALKNISLSVNWGEILGIIGRNGAGKTTLLNIIAGTLSMTSGRMNVRGRVLGLFNLGIGFQDELTGRENIFLNGAILGADKTELNDKLESIIEFSELGDFIDMPLGTYSQGMRLRLGFSILVSLRFDILVIDEALAVGDMPFQSKCFQRLMDFKRAGKTLVLVSQSIDLIERLCDRTALLDHGNLLFIGNTTEAINKYRSLLNTETFFVGPRPGENSLIKETKKWSDKISNWGKKQGTQEIVIEKVEYLNRFGFRCSRIRSGQRLKIKVSFSVKNDIQEPHFGVAIFRNDGVYGYGPNTKFDGYHVRRLKRGDGYFILDLYEFLLAPGEYRLSIAVWDKNETLAFSYHEGCYGLTVIGNNNLHNELIRMPYASYPRMKAGQMRQEIAVDSFKENGNEQAGYDCAGIESVKLVSGLGKKTGVLMTNEPARLIVKFKDASLLGKAPLFWAGIYRDDGIYCQGVKGKVRRGKVATIKFPCLSLLPGGYKISAGIWDAKQEKFIFCCDDVCSFRMVFDREDHGTIYLKHNWKGSFFFGETKCRAKIL